MQPLDRLALIVGRLRRQSEQLRHAEPLQLGEMVAKAAGLRRAAARARDAVPAGRQRLPGPAGARIDVDHGPARQAATGSTCAPSVAGKREVRQLRPGEMARRAVVLRDRQIVGQDHRIVQNSAIVILRIHSWSDGLRHFPADARDELYLATSFARRSRATSSGTRRSIAEGGVAPTRTASTPPAHSRTRNYRHEQTRKPAALRRLRRLCGAGLPFVAPSRPRPGPARRSRPVQAAAARLRQRGARAAHRRADHDDPSRPASRGLRQRVQRIRQAGARARHHADREDAGRCRLHPAADPAAGEEQSRRPLEPHASSGS